MRHFRTMAFLTACAALGLGQPKGKHEGIKVHGHWVVDIRNRDGSLASRHEFENALITAGGSGPGVFYEILSGGNMTAGWQIQFSCLTNPATANGTPCGPNNPQVLSYGCGSTFFCSDSLTVQASGGQVILQGTWTLPSQFQQPVYFPAVSTNVNLCSSTHPGACSPNTPFTSAATNLVLNYGQTLLVTVNFSFS